MEEVHKGCPGQRIVKQLCVMLLTLSTDRKCLLPEVDLQSWLFFTCSPTGSKVLIKINTITILPVKFPFSGLTLLVGQWEELTACDTSASQYTKLYLWQTWYNLENFAKRRAV